jgi:hypothetical protein
MRYFWDTDYLADWDDQHRTKLSTISQAVSFSRFYTMPKAKLSPSRELGAKVIFAAMQILKENGGQ